MMKLTITGFFDYKKTLDQSIETTKKNQLSTLALRQYEGRSLIEMNDQDIKNLLTKLKSDKIELSMLDTMIEPYPIESKKKHQEALDQFRYMVKLSSKLKVDYLLFELPIFHDCIEEFSAIKKILEPYIEQAIINGKTIIVKPSLTYKTNVYAYLFKKLKTKNLMMAFDPSIMMQNGESVTTSYRLLKKDIIAFIAKDKDHQHQPQLLGYGKTEMLNIFKRLIRDHFDGFVLADHDFKEEDLLFEPEKIGFFKRLIGKEKKRKEEYIQTLQKRIFPNEPNKLVTLDDILDNQIKVLRVVFK